MLISLPTMRSSRSDLMLVVGYWLVVVPVLLLQYRADTHWPLGHLIQLAAATMLYDTATVTVLVGGLLPLLLEGRPWLGLALVPVFLTASGVAYRGLYGWLLGQPLVVHSALGLGLAVVAHAKSYGLLAVLVTGKRYFATQRRVLQLQKAQTESELRTLRARVDPHFLFNNLHVLHTLIGQDAAVAGHFLHCFASLYRYLLQHQETDFVPLTDELRFLGDYVYLLQQRFGPAYAVHTTLAPGLDPARLYTVPGTLQTLVENAVKHNQGGDTEPLLICLDVQASTLQVHNPRRPRRTPPGGPGGTGLASLRERYRLLTGQLVLVAATATDFTVTVPLLGPPPANPVR